MNSINLNMIDIIVQIGDFGMARDLVDDNYYMMSDHRAIPVKWTAPEVNAC